MPSLINRPEPCYTSLEVIKPPEPALLSFAFFDANPRKLEKIDAQVGELRKIHPGDQRASCIREMRKSLDGDRLQACFRAALSQTDGQPISPLRYSFLLLERTLNREEQTALMKLYHDSGLHNDAYRVSVMGRLSGFLEKGASASTETALLTVSKEQTGLYVVTLKSPQEQKAYYFNPVSNKVRSLDFNNATHVELKGIQPHLLDRVVSTFTAKQGLVFHPSPL